MGDGLPLGSLRPADLHDQDRLITRQRLSRYGHKFVGSADALDHERYDPRLWVVDQKGEIVDQIQVNLVATGNRVAKADPALSRTLHPITQGAPALKNESHGSRTQQRQSRWKAQKT